MKTVKWKNTFIIKNEKENALHSYYDEETSGHENLASSEIAGANPDLKPRRQAELHEVTKICLENCQDGLQTSEPATMLRQNNCLENQSRVSQDQLDAFRSTEDLGLILGSHSHFEKCFSCDRELRVRRRCNLASRCITSSPGSEPSRTH